MTYKPLDALVQNNSTVLPFLKSSHSVSNAPFSTVASWSVPRLIKLLFVYDRIDCSIELRRIAKTASFSSVIMIFLSSSTVISMGLSSLSYCNCNFFGSLGLTCSLGFNSYCCLSNFNPCYLLGRLISSSNSCIF